MGMPPEDKIRPLCIPLLPDEELIVSFDCLMHESYKLKGDNYDSDWFDDYYEFVDHLDETVCNRYWKKIELAILEIEALREQIQKLPMSKRVKLEDMMNQNDSSKYVKLFIGKEENE